MRKKYIWISRAASIPNSIIHPTTLETMSAGIQSWWVREFNVYMSSMAITQNFIKDLHGRDFLDLNSVAVKIALLYAIQQHQYNEVPLAHKTLSNYEDRGLVFDLYISSASGPYGVFIEVCDVLSLDSNASTEAIEQRLRELVVPTQQEDVEQINACRKYGILRARDAHNRTNIPVIYVYLVGHTVYWADHTGCSM